MQPILQDKDALAKQICVELRAIINTDIIKLDAKHQDTFNKIKYLYSYTGKYPYKPEGVISKFDDILSVNILNQMEMEQREKILDALLYSTQARLFATEFTPYEEILDLKEHSFHYFIYNDFFKDPKPHYGAADLEEIIHDLNDEKKIFDFDTDPKTGLISSGDGISPDLNWQYNADSCIHGLWQKQNDPFSWRKSMIINAAAINNADIFSTVQKIARDPDWYRRAHEDQDILSRGITDAFDPKTVNISNFGSPIVRDIKIKESKTPRRVVSTAMFLLSILETLEAGINSDEWGFDYGADFNEQNREIVFKAIFNLITFLMSINWNVRHNLYDGNSPTTSLWGEIVYWDGASLDTAYTALALEKFCSLVFSERFSETTAIVDLKKAVNEYVGDLPFYANCLNESYVRMLIQACTSKVYEWVVKPILYEHTQAIHNEENKLDSSLALLAASDYRFSEDVFLDAEIRAHIVKSLHMGLADGCGMKRYNRFLREDYVTGNNVKIFDSHLNLNGYITTNLTPLAQIVLGQKPEVAQVSPKFFSTTEFTKRQKIAKPEYSAQWSLGPSACIQALAKAKMKLVSHIKKIKIAPPETEVKLKEIDIMLAHFINHSLSIIAGMKDVDMLRVDGTELPNKYNIMESYQAISDLAGKVKWIPGGNTSAWTMAQLYDGLQLALKAEKELRSISNS
ncbi:MAG: hypothetical protein HRT47_02260 [Candidatus Caenarcaniphilales bacterium]|nr:hypothetical protein [Candidatus Caenarcaniphilales bacterium]